MRTLIRTLFVAILTASLFAIAVWQVKSCYELYHLIPHSCVETVCKQATYLIISTVLIGIIPAIFMAIVIFKKGPSSIILLMGVVAVEGMLNGDLFTPALQRSFLEIQNLGYNSGETGEQTRLKDH